MLESYSYSYIFVYPRRGRPAALLRSRASMQALAREHRVALDLERRVVAPPTPPSRKPASGPYPLCVQQQMSDFVEGDGAPSRPGNIEGALTAKGDGQILQQRMAAERAR